MIGQAPSVSIDHAAPRLDPRWDAPRSSSVSGLRDSQVTQSWNDSGQDIPESGCRVDRQQSRAARSQDPEIASESSSVIDRVPHRPPDPTQDFQAYSDYIQSLTSQEYDRLFSIPIPGEFDDSDSHADSNERFVQTFDYSETSAEAVSHNDQENSNHTIGSREEAVRHVQSQAAAQRMQMQEDRDGFQDTGSWNQREWRRHDEVSPNMIPERGALPNNAYLQAAGSSDQVVLPTRRPTVNPPYPLRRIPLLEHQTEEQRAYYRGLPRPVPLEQDQDEEARELGSETSTDSGEYTVRDGSLPSSGGYEGRVSETETPRPVRSTSMQPPVQGGIALAATTVVASLSSASSSAVVEHTRAIEQ